MAMGGDGTLPRPGESKIVGVTWNANGLNVRKRREMVEMLKKKGIDGCVGRAGDTSGVAMGGPGGACAPHSRPVPPQVPPHRNFLAKGFRSRGEELTTFGWSVN